MHIDILIKSVRKEQSMTLTQLSNKSGVSRSHINDLENELKAPSLLVMVKLAKALNVPITELYRVKW